MAVERKVDIADLGPLPANARVEGWWPQQEVLARAAVVLGHGGFGTTMGAVAAGVPQVVVPIFGLRPGRQRPPRGGRGRGPGRGSRSGGGHRGLCGGSRRGGRPAYLERERSVAAAVAALPPAAESDLRGGACGAYSGRLSPAGQITTGCRGRQPNSAQPRRFLDLMCGCAQPASSTGRGRSRTWPFYRGLDCPSRRPLRPPSRPSTSGAARTGRTSRPPRSLRPPPATLAKRCEPACHPH